MIQRCQDIFQGSDTGGVVVWGGDVGTNAQDGAGPENFSTQGRATAHQEAAKETGGGSSKNPSLEEAMVEAGFKVIGTYILRR